MFASADWPQRRFSYARWGGGGPADWTPVCTEKFGVQDLFPACGRRSSDGGHRHERSKLQRQAQIADSPGDGSAARPMRLYLDDDLANPLLAGLLRKAGHDVVLPADVGMSGQDDAVHLTYAIRD